MILIYEKKANRIIAATSKVFDNGSWREPQLEELYPDADLSGLGYVYVEDSPEYYLTPQDQWQLKLDENGVPVGVHRKPALPEIHLTTTAQDTDGDDLPELPADA